MKWKLLVGILVIASCKTAPPDINNEILPELRNNWDEFIEGWESEDARKCASFYLEDAINLPPGAKVNEGRDEIETFYNFLFDIHLSADYNHEIKSIEGNNTDIIEYGSFQVDWVRNDSTSYSYHARTLTHWKNSTSGWKIAKFIFNNPPAED